jgi:hypothetical protein
MAARGATLTSACVTAFLTTLLDQIALLGHQRRTALGFGDAQRAARAIDLDAGQRAALRRVGGADPREVGRRKLDAGAIEADELATAAA